MCISWEPLRYLGRLESIDWIEFSRGDVGNRSILDWKTFERKFALRTADIITKNEYDFLFYYFEMADVVGHSHGFMSAEYCDALYCAGECLEYLYNHLPAGYQFIVIADHGGHSTKHNDPANQFDMTIPVYMAGSAFKKNVEIDNVHILDIAPTICDLMGLMSTDTFQGSSLMDRRGETI